VLVVNTQPFELVYTILCNHKHLGCVLQPHVVQKNSLGNFTLTHQRVFAKTADYYAQNISLQDLEIISLLDELDENYIFKRFHHDSKKKIRAADFFEKQAYKLIIDNEVKPYIEEKMNMAFEMLKGRTIYKMGNDNNPTSQAIYVSEHKASVLFHFRRGPQGTNYFPTIKHNGSKVEFMYKGAQLITYSPAWMLLDNAVFTFEKGVDGKKFVAFLNKRFIQIPQSAEENYFTKFVTQLVEKYDVYAEGFEIRTDKYTPFATLKVNTDAQSDQLTLVLKFQYGPASFEYHSENDISAVVEKLDNDYIFKRIKRNRILELELSAQIEELGLVHIDGPLFTLKQKSSLLYTGELFSIESTNKYDFLEWVSQHQSQLNALNISIEHSNDLSKYYLGKREVKFEVSEHRDWFDVKAIVHFGEFSFPFLVLKSNILSGKREFMLPNGQLAIIPEEWFGKLAGMIELSLSDDEIKLEKHHIGLIQEVINDEKQQLMRVGDKLSRIKAYGEVRPAEVPLHFDGDLRPYQKAGFDWFYFLKENKFGGCLADDMGLGKTIQTLALLQKEKEIYEACKSISPLKSLALPAEYNGSLNQSQISLFQTADAIPHKVDVEDNEQHAGHQIPESLRTFNRTSLIIVPNSLVYNWYHETHKFTPKLKVHIYTGINREKNVQLFQRYDLIITTYGTVRVDIDVLKEFNFNYIILDESQSIKNPNSLSSKAVRQLKGSHRLVLTGTPIENSVQELWSQLSFINPGLVGSLSAFNERFVVPIEKGKDPNRMAQLRAIIKPFVLRRTKDQVAKELPPKIEQVKYCNMTDEQADEYEKIKSYYRNEIIKSISEVGISKSQLILLQGLTKLRQVANHPRLINPDYVGQAGKFDEIIAMSETAAQENHKVLLFSQFVKQLDIYRQHFDSARLKYCYLDGSTPTELRQKQVNTFQERDDIQFFLISLKAGGVGLNLTAADYVFITDPWWNPAVEQQAVDRTHRIGQTKTVFNYKFITKDTVEEKILALQANKKELAGNIITTEESFIKTFDIDAILDILS
jgi:SNF2 family DNA or RNA helicase